MKDNWDTPGKLAIGGGADQRAINLAIKQTKIKFGRLDLKEYPNGARYFDNVNSSLDRLEKNVKQLIRDLGKEGMKKESLEVASLYKKHIIEFKVKLKDFERKNRD